MSESSQPIAEHYLVIAVPFLAARYECEASGVPFRTSINPSFHRHDLVFQSEMLPQTLR